MRGCENFEEGLEFVLMGREARKELQEKLLRNHAWVLQIGLNIPGIPKNLPGDGVCLRRTEEMLFSRKTLFVPKVRRLCENGAGKALVFGGDFPEAREIKKISVALEENVPWGRLLDMDVLTSRGGLSRKDLGLPPRKCLLCEKEAKICARLGSHGFEELRLRAEELLALARKDESL